MYMKLKYNFANSFPPSIEDNFARKSKPHLTCTYDMDAS